MLLVLVILLSITLSIGGVLGTLFNYGFFGDLKMSVMECLILGTIIASTDPLAALSVFYALEADPMLTMIMFVLKFLLISRYGESTVNDAVSIVMFNTLSKFLLSSMSAAGIFEAIGIFIVMFVGSAVGSCFLIIIIS